MTLFTVLAGVLTLFMASKMANSGQLPWIALFPLVLAVFCSRARWIGLYISDDGVRIRWVAKTRTISWADIAKFETRPAPPLYTNLTMETPLVQMIFIVLKNERVMKTPLMARPLITLAEIRDESYRMFLPAQDFGDAMRRLKAALAAAG